jgi:hypothetical protein
MSWKRVSHMFLIYDQNVFSDLIIGFDFFCLCFVINVHIFYAGSSRYDNNKIQMSPALLLTS